MGNIDLGTLNKISYENLEQFIDVINRNFAVVQNSPLFKGIPGTEGDDGEPGPTGIRGSKIFFIDFVKFNLQFPTEVTLSTHIDLVFLNSKLNNIEGKTKILTAIESPNLVDKDIFVLTNSLLISYNYSENKFYDTGKSLNTSVTQEIQEIINDLFQSYLPILQSGIKNVFNNYSTLAKNYSDNNNTGITTTVNQTSVYSPFIQGVTSSVGIPIENHKYYGISQNLNSENTDNTVVFGSIIKYYKLLMNTINTDGSQTLTSDYAPGVNNIPAGIFLQDTYNNGLLFGFKGKTNLKTFGSIFKNDSDELEIKSDSGKLNSDFSSIKIHKNYLRYDKLVQFNDSLELSNNIFVGGHIENNNVKTGYYAFDDNIDLFDELGIDIAKENIVSLNNPKVIGPINEDGNGGIIQNKYLINHANNYYLRATNYRNKVLVTDDKGLIKSNITMETSLLGDYNTSVWGPLTEITGGIDKNKILSTYYFNYLIRKINLLFNTQINGLYWTKAEFNSNVIPNLRLNNDFKVDKTANLGGILNVDSVSSNVNIRSTNTSILSTNITFAKQFKNNVIVLNDSRQVRNDVFVDYEQFDTSIFDMVSLSTPFPYLSTSSTTFELIQRHQYNRLISYINLIRSSLSGNYWTKPDFESFIIPNINTSNGVFSRKFLGVSSGITSAQTNGDFRNNSDNIFYSDTVDRGNYLGGDWTTLNSNQTSIRGFGLNNVLTTNKSGIILPTSMISSLPSITTATYNSLNNQTVRTLADNKTIASLILGITTNFDTLKNYIDSQISLLNQQLTTQINNLATDVYTKLQVINNDLISIHNELATKASIAYVDNHVNNINTNINNINATLATHTTQIADIYALLATKVDKSVFEPWKAIVDAFMLNTVSFPKGGIILWEGKIVGGTLQAAIPTGWEEVTSMRGRVAVGWSNGLYDASFYSKFSVLGETGGTAKHSLTATENGPHTHGLPISKPGGNGEGHRWGVDNWSGVQTGSSGSGTPHENTQPYKVLIYLRSLKGV